MTRYLSAISICIALIYTALKTQWDRWTVEEIKLMATFNTSGSEPLVTAHADMLLFYLIPLLVSFGLSVAGLYQDNRYKLLGVGLNILALVYLFVPVHLWYGPTWT
jgi:hypothetical protein